jgi:carboxyl-terminal processing protease
LAEVTAESCTGQLKKLSIRRESAFWPPVQPSFQWSTITVAPGKTIGYLRIDGFGDDGAELADRAMTDLGKAQAIVLDVRNNPGGNASALRLASYFTEGEQPALGILTRDWLKRLKGPARPRDVLAAPKLVGAYTTAKVFEGLSRGQGGAMLWTEDMGAKRWTKPVVLLIGENSGSAAEGFAWLMKLKTKAKLIGRPTAGALLGSEVVDVGSGWSMRVPVHGIWAPDGVDYGDRPVPPEISVKRTREDICAGRDPDLEKALDLLSH